MEIFVHNLPIDKKAAQIQRGIAKAIKGVLGDKVAWEWSPFKHKRALATLTLPTWNLGTMFLNHYSNGLRMHGRTVKFTLSKNPSNQRLVEGLLSKMAAMEQMPSDSEDEEPPQTKVFNTPNSVSHYLYTNYGEDYVREGLPFESLEWGVWTTDGQFGSCGTIHLGGLITHNSESSRLDILGILDTYYPLNVERAPVEENGIAIDDSIIQEILVDRHESNPRLYLTLDRIPRFWSHNPTRPTLSDNIDYDEEAYRRAAMREFRGSTSAEEQTVYRVPALCLEHAADAPYCTVYVFKLRTPNVEMHLRRLLKSMSRGSAKETPATISTSELDFGSSHNQLCALYSQYDYRIAFQMESLVRNCLLIPTEVINLNSLIEMLVKDHRTITSVRILQNFALRLPVRRYDELSQGINYEEMLDTAVKYFPSTWQPRIDPNAVWIHRLDITPAAYNMEGSCWMGSNRFLRFFPEHHDHFLKVSFVEEDLTVIRYTRDLDLSMILKRRWRDFFRDEATGGIKLAGKHFTFLGFSSSSLREHSTWFIAPFEHEGETITADLLRDRLGDFREIRCPPLYAARLGQTFTTTSYSLVLSPNEVSTIADVKTDEHVFSDGVGTMSQDMLDRIWKATMTDNKQVKPVVYQVRLGGSKGVLSLDPTLQGARICLRPSMTKFPAPNTHLEIANKAGALPFFLNRQLIVILESLGLPQECLMNLLHLEIGKLEQASRDFDEALGLCQRYGLGQATTFPTILKTLHQHDVGGILEMPFFRRCNSLALSHALKQIKYKSRVAVDESWTLMGVIDEFGYLGEGEIYVCLKDEEDEKIKYLKGSTLVTRMPALHCGDVQRAYAVVPSNANHPLFSLHNCIVFSSKGSRPIPNMLSGGDLDGDLFQISQNAELYPTNWEPPDSYPSVRPRELDRECRMDDLADFFIDFIINDRLGQLSTMHVILADQSEYGALDPGCVKLSQLASIATDFPKTGLSVDMKEAPRVNMRIKPDFMSQRQLSDEDYISETYDDFARQDTRLYYKSQKVLGEMYRSVNITNLLNDWNVNSGWNKDGPMELWEEIEGNLQQLIPPYQSTWPEHVAEAEQLFEAYMEGLETIEYFYHPLPWKQQRLSEPEIFLQCIRMDTSNKRIRGRGRHDYLHGLRQTYGGLVESVRSDVSGTVEGRYQKAAACFYVGITSAKKRRDKEGESFSWIIIPELYKTWTEVQKNGFIDREPVEVEKPVEAEVQEDESDAWHVYDSERKIAKEDNIDGTLREIMRRFGITGI